MPKLILLGNCVAERLTLLLSALFNAREQWCPALDMSWEIAHRAPIYNLPQEEIAPLAREVLQCDLVFSQPLFSFGPCNTEALRPQLGNRLHLFSAPNFEAYFPDVLEIRPYPEPLKFSPPMEWSSKVIVKCKAAGIPSEEVGNIYPNHSMFKAESVANAIITSLEIYKRRDTDVEIGSFDFVKNNYTNEPLFYTWNHPGDSLLKHLLIGILRVLGLDEKQRQAAIAFLPWAKDCADGWAYWGFGYNEWPIITRWHNYFHFPGREYFRIGGQKLSITDVAIAWYNFYDHHPQIYQKALASMQLA